MFDFIPIETFDWKDKTVKNHELGFKIGNTFELCK